MVALLRQLACALRLRRRVGNLAAEPIIGGLPLVGEYLGSVLTLALDSRIGRAATGSPGQRSATALQ